MNRHRGGGTASIRFALKEQQLFKPTRVFISHLAPGSAGSNCYGHLCCCCCCCCIVGRFIV